MNSPLSRRRFLHRSLGMLGASVLVRRGLVAAASPTQVAADGFKVFTCDWVLKKPCDPEAFEMAARIGFDGLQVDFGREVASDGSLPLFAPERQDRLLAAAEQHGVPIASLAFGVLNKIPYKSDPAAERWVLDSVAILPRLRQRIALLAFFSAGDLVDDEAGIAETIRRLKNLAPRAEAAGLVYGIESWLKVPVLERILDAVNSPSIQVYYDVGNMQKVGEDVGAAIRRLGRERICQVHCKDYDDLYGKGSMDFSHVRRAFDAVGYRGWVGVEGVKTPLGLEPSLRYDLEYLRTVFPPDRSNHPIIPS